MQTTAARAQSSSLGVDFRRDLLAWFDRHQRDLPWRRTRDPYAIWLSEIMLQQTRVAAAIPYYGRFLTRFPRLHALAEAPEADVLTHWAGLGYYSRARNLHRAAKQMAASGGFPSDYERIRALPGIGDYTAAAIASIAFGKVHAAVDGNVLRVLSRVYADPADIAKPAARRHFWKTAHELIDVARPGDFNQAMMELGATICLPRNPQCLLCPVHSLCQAHNSGTQAAFPVKTSPEKQVFARRKLLWVEKNSAVLAWRRAADSRFMAGFWELPETEQLPDAIPGPVIAAFRHSITFHNYTFDLARAAEPASIGDCEWLPLESLPTVPVSTVFRKAARIFSRTSR